MPWVPIFLAAGVYAGSEAQAKGPDTLTLVWAAIVGLAVLNLYMRARAKS